MERLLVVEKKRGVLRRKKDVAGLEERRVRGERKKDAIIRLQFDYKIA
jgi:hypothetical protein